MPASTDMRHRYERLLSDFFALKRDVLPGHSDDCLYGLGAACSCTCGVEHDAPSRSPRHEAVPSGPYTPGSAPRRRIAQPDDVDPWRYSPVGCWAEKAQWERGSPRRWCSHSR
jgi:hypothetical protein